MNTLPGQHYLKSLVIILLVLPAIAIGQANFFKQYAGSYYILPFGIDKPMNGKKIRHTPMPATLIISIQITHVEKGVASGFASN